MSMLPCRRQDIPAQASWSLVVTERQHPQPAKCPTVPQPTEIPALPEMPPDLREDPLDQQVAQKPRDTMNQANRDKRTLDANRRRRSFLRAAGRGPGGDPDWRS